MAECSKCGKELDTTGYPLWCKACRAKHKRESEDTRMEMLEKRVRAEGRRDGYRNGIEDLKTVAQQRFNGLGNRMLSGHEAAALVQKLEIAQ